MVCVQLPEDGITLFALFFQGGHGCLLFRSGLLQARLLCFQIGLGLGNSLGDQPHFFHQPLIRLSDLPDHVQSVDQVRKALGLEQHLPVGQAALLLHGPDTGTVADIQFIQIGLRLIQLSLRLGDEGGIGGDLLVQVVQLTVQQEDLAVHLGLVCHHLLNGFPVGIHLCLQCILLGLNLCLKGFQTVDLLTDLCGGSGLSTGHSGKQQRCRQKPGSEFA